LQRIAKRGNTDKLTRIVLTDKEMTAILSLAPPSVGRTIQFVGKIRMSIFGTMAASRFAVRSCLCAVLVFAAVLFRAQAAPLGAVEFPFKFHDGFLWVEVTVPQSAEPLNFLFDSGASASVVNLKTAQRLKLPLGNPGAVRGVDATTTGFFPQRLMATADKIPLKKDYLAVDLSQLGRACRCCVDGLIGMDFFRGKVVQIDFAEHKIRLLKSTKGIEGKTVITLKMRPCGMEVPVQVNGGEPRFVRLDTGCASPLQWVTAGVQPKDCSQRPAIALSRFTVSETKSTVRLGNVEFQSVPTGIHAREIFAGEAGLIGNGILSGFKTVTIDTRRSQLILGERISN
jgi:hypothetical protein